MNKLTRYRLYLVIWSFLTVLVPIAESVEVVNLQRGLHPDFELFVIYCDTLPQVSVNYDQVLNQVTLNLTNAQINPIVLDEVNRLQSGVCLQRLSNSSPAELLFQVRGTVVVSTYLVSGPPAVLLDLCQWDGTKGTLPYELDRNEYLKQGGQAERRGDFDLALKYIDRIRENSGDEPALTHRAGVIQQRLGRWELALECLAKTAGLPEFAADAHARRAMIYLTMGDTSASGQAWSSYFHRQQNAATPDPNPNKDYTAFRSAPTIESNRPNYAFSPRFLPVIEAGDGNYFYLGGGLLIVGVVALISVLTGGWRGRRSEFEFQNYPFDLPSPRFAGWRPLPTRPLSILETPSTQTSQDISSDGLPPTENQPAKTEFQGISPRVVKSYINSSSKLPPLPITPDPSSPSSSSSSSSSSFQPSPGDTHRKLVDRIISQAQAGVADSEIAGQMGISRDEVRMILNLARLAQREQS